MFYMFLLRVNRGTNFNVRVAAPEGSSSGSQAALNHSQAEATTATTSTIPAPGSGGDNGIDPDDFADLAYTPKLIGMHTDNPYRVPTPAIQLLHAIDQCWCGNGLPQGTPFQEAEFPCDQCTVRDGSDIKTVIVM